jgi:hypothetical protein
MTESTTQPTEPQEPAATIEKGTYEIIRDRLRGHAKTLQEQAEALNGKRLELFGGTELAVIGNERIRTENNCLPRDIIPVADKLLFGYKVFLGLKTETAIHDVLSLHRFEKTADGFSFEPVPEGSPERAMLEDPRFVEDFQELYRYYKQSRLLQLRRLEGGKVLAVFQIGAAPEDVRVFRWAVAPTGEVTYIDNRGERDHTFPPTHDFEWTLTTREHHVAGRHPHVNILDTVFVETVGGDLTVKVEDNTEDGRGVYREPVDDLNQSLDDGEIHYAKLGILILLKIKPYREEAYRYLVYNTRTHGVSRIDAIGQSCVQLPEDHGIIFPGGYYLQSGETKSFATDTEGLLFKRRIRSPNGEDVLYLFYHPEQGRFVLLPYNMIRKEVANPIDCHGFSLFDDGTMVIFRVTTEEPTRVHGMQIWQTPFVSIEHDAAAPTTGSYLEKIGNPELVRGISDAFSLCRAIADQQPTVQIYEDLIRATVRVLDSYHWLGREEVGNLLATLQQVHATAELIVDEFEKVESIRRQARKAVQEAETGLQELFATLKPESWNSVESYVDALSQLRRRQGHLITLKEMRYVDQPRLEELEGQVVERFEAVSAQAVEFLMGETALVPYHQRLEAIEGQIDQITKVADAQPVRAELEAQGEGLDLLAEVVGGLQIDDATVRTQILEGISEVLGGLNRTRALLENRRKGLLSKEAVAEFGVQFKLFSQSVTSALALADNPDKCDEQLSKMMLLLEDLESRFSEFDDYLEQLGTKREDVYEAFSAKKQRLLDERQRRADQLVQAADRILTGLARRTATLGTEDDLNTFFAGDAMVSRLRDLASKLRGLEASVAADEVESRLKAAREDAARGLRDRRDLFEEGAAVLKLGRHRFSVNTQALDLTLVPRAASGRSGDTLTMTLHMTGTDFYQPLEDPALDATRDYWQQLLVSETPTVYRGEYLAASILAQAEEEADGLSLDQLRQAQVTGDGLLEQVRAYAAERYNEGYERGLHDHDGARILDKLLGLYATADLLRFAPRPRAWATLFWALYHDGDAPTQRSLWQRRARSLARLRSTFAHSPEIGRFTAQLATAIGEFFAAQQLPLDAEEAHVAGVYLFEELSRSPVRFVVSAEAVTLRDAFQQHLEEAGSLALFQEDLREMENDLANRYPLVEAWVSGFLDEMDAMAKASKEAGDVTATRTRRAAQTAALRPALPGAVVLLLAEKLDREPSSALGSVTVDGLLGQHPRIEDGKMALRLDEFLTRLGTFRRRRVPGFRHYQELRHQILERWRKKLRLAEYRPKVMSAFVRNRLINEVYLPLIGDNLAKQMGALGDAKRTDQMGMLLLISPPGYGKTTLMEYVANRLGMVFLKVNGPALGHGVTSLDPAEAPNATARQEVEKINLGFEMANNVLLYLDDIQHTHPELLQKFISLCDAQRRVEGVWNGETRTYDLRGKRFSVCMAGNPYTESGEKFQIPDMLANRADVYNLGDILDGKDELFALSYLENALTSNPVLAPLTTRGLDDVYKLVRMAQGEALQADQLSHGYSAAEVQEILAVLKKMIQVQGVLLQVNQQYILSASQDDAYRTEPRFQLQGSYRNMNKLAEKIVPVMNDRELEALIDDHYTGEAQTLTTGAEHNLLKLAELRGRMSAEQEKRWAEVKRSFARVQAMGSSDTDPATRVVGQLGLVTDRLGDIGKVIEDGARAEQADRAGRAEQEARPDVAATLAPVLEKLHQSLAASIAAAQQARPKKGEEDGAAAKALAEALAGSMAQIATSLESTGETLTAKLAETLAAVRSQKAQAPPASAAKKAGPEAASAQLAPYLDGLNKTLAALARGMQGSGKTIVQTLPEGVHDLLDRTLQSIDERMIPAVRTLSKKVKASKDEDDQNLQGFLDGTLKRLDELRDLVRTLRKLDTRGVVRE